MFVTPSECDLMIDNFVSFRFNRVRVYKIGGVSIKIGKFGFNKISNFRFKFEFSSNFGFKFEFSRLRACSMVGNRDFIKLGDILVIYI